MVSQSKEDISVCTGLRDVAMATKFLAKIGKKYLKNGHNFSCMRHIHAEFASETWSVHCVPENSSVTLPYTRDEAALPRQPIWGIKLL